MAELLAGIYKAQDPELAMRKVEPIIRGRQIFHSSESTVSLYAQLLCDLE